MQIYPLKSNHSSSCLLKGTCHRHWSLGRGFVQGFGHSCLSQDSPADQGVNFGQGTAPGGAGGALEGWSVTLWDREGLSLGHNKSRFKQLNQKQMKGGNKLFCTVK